MTIELAVIDLCDEGQKNRHIEKDGLGITVRVLIIISVTFSQKLSDSYSAIDT